MSITSTNKTAIGYSVETIAGITDVTPTFQLIPTTGGAPSAETPTAVSQVIRDDRQTDDLIVVDETVGGEVNIHLTGLPHSPLLKSLMRADAAQITTIAITDTDIAAVAAGFTSVGNNFVALGVKVGQYLRVKGFADATINTVYRVTSVAVGQIDTTPAPAATEIVGASATIAGELYYNGATDTPDSYTFMHRVKGIAAPAFFYTRGQQVSKLSLDIAVASIISGSIGLMGLTEDPTVTEIAGQTTTAEQTYKLINSVTSVNAITGTGLPAACFSNITVNIDNKIEPAKCIGTLGANALAAFSLDASGNISIFFEDLATYTAYKNSTAFEISFMLLGADGYGIGITFPFCKFETLSSPRSGKDQFLMLDGTYRALRDPVSNSMAQLNFISP